MNISVIGKLIDCVHNKSKDGQKDYYSLNIYCEGNLIRVGVPFEIWDYYRALVGDEVEVKDISLWSKGQTSFYVKG